MSRRAGRWAAWCLAGVVTASGCAEREAAPAGELAGGEANAQQGVDAAAPAEKAKTTTLAEAPPSLRSATIAAMQRGAGPEYDLDPVRDGGSERAYEGELAAMLRVLRIDAAGAAIARGYDDEAELGLRLEGAGCAGEAARAGAAEPEVVQNRVSYQRALGGGRAIEEWYVAGPLGLEQGFTIGESWGCAGELELDVAVSGARVEAGRREGELGFVSDASGERFRYGELAAWDAEGKPLTARMERREGGVRIVVDAAGAVFPVVVDPLVATQQAKLVPGDPDAGDWFGDSVAIDGDTAIVGAPYDDDGGSYSGSAYVFVRSGSAWVQQAKLVAADAAAGDYFGNAVAISDHTALVAAQGDGGSAGSAYVFVRSGSAWAQQAKLVASDGAAYQLFASSLAISGDTVLAGAYADDDGGLGSGSAYVFVRSGSAWTQQAKLTASDAAPSDHFGHSVALSADTALVGALKDDHAAGCNAGSAYVFVRSGGAWAQQAKLTSSAASADDNFGASVALSGHVALVGAPQDYGSGGQGMGSAFLFVRTGSTWAERSNLTASDGWALALTADTALVGSRLNSGPGGSGSAYVYLLEGNLDLGQACTADGDCASGFCADGVCCNTACGAGAVDDCLVCSVAAGASVNGICAGTSGNACDDGNTCNTGDLCVAGVCMATMGLDCDDGNDCTQNDCDGASSCLNTPLAAGAACNDGDACMVVDECDGSGTCQGTAPLDCDDSNECTVDSCDSTSGCLHDAVVDGTPCTGGECLSGACDAPQTACDDRRRRQRRRRCWRRRRRWRERPRGRLLLPRDRRAGREWRAARARVDRARRSRDGGALASPSRGLSSGEAPSLAGRTSPLLQKGRRALLRGASLRVVLSKCERVG